MAMMPECPEWLEEAWRLLCHAATRGGITQYGLAKKLGKSISGDSILVVMEKNGYLVCENDQGRLFPFMNKDLETRRREAGEVTRPPFGGHRVLRGEEC